MEACLYHPEFGYYTRGLNFLTQPPQDFLTAPEHTPLFGYTLANWVAKTWQKAGAPTPFTLIEVGPGRGTLMHDVLTHLHTAHPACSAAAQPVLVETSPTLIKIQQQTLAAFPQTQWAESLPVTLSSYNPIILLANELLDAFPANHFKQQEDGTWHQTVIALNETDQLTLATAPVATPADPAPALTAFLQTLKSQNLLAALLIDYGYHTSLESRVTNHDSLQALHRHQKVSPLHLPGESDLTTHVNFNHAMETLGPAHCTLQDLAPFLLGNGIIDLGLSPPPLKAKSSKLTANLQHPSQQSQLHRLLHPAQMGTLFKVLCYMPSTP